jgi:hypothetical protein
MHVCPATKEEAKLVNRHSGLNGAVAHRHRGQSRLEPQGEHLSFYFPDYSLNEGYSG